MKNFIYICIGVAVCLATLSACVKDPTTDAYETNDSKAFFSVGEARMFFEESFADETRSLSESSTAKFLDPGDYTPLWGDAQMSQNATLGSVDVPILAGRKYRAIRSEFKNGKSTAYTVEVMQRLVVEKDVISKQKRYYIVTLIPDNNYLINNTKNVSLNILDPCNNLKFSGIWLVMDGVFPVEMKQYLDGVVVEHYSLNSVARETNLVQFKAMITKLQNMSLLCCNCKLQTRYYPGEEIWDIYDDLNDEEKDFLTDNPIASYDFYDNSKIAQQAAVDYFGINGADDESDAFRHAYWSALNASDQGVELASEYGTIHEGGSSSPSSNMDLYNNNVGYSIGANNPNATDEELAELIMEAIQNGSLQLEP